MANPIKYSTTQDAKASLRKGSIAVGGGSEGYGPSATTGYYAGINPPPNGYTVYALSADHTPNIYVASNGADLVRIANTLGGTVTTESDALLYLTARTNTTVLDKVSDNMVTDGLVLNLDASSVNSYPRSGTTWYDTMSGNGYNGSLINGPIYSSLGEGIIILDGVNDYIQINNSVTTPELSPPIATFNIWFKPSSNALTNSVTSLISRGNYNTAGGFFIHLANNTIINNTPSVNANCSYSITDGYRYDNTSAYLPNGFNVWSNVTVVYDTQISLYINGVHKQTINRSFPTIIYGNNSINTGGDTNLILCAGLGYAPTISNGYWEPYNGSISKMQMYNRRLSQSEVLQNYYKAPIVTDGLSIALDAGNIVSYESGSATAYSLVGSNNGTLTNGVGYSKDNGGSWVFDGVDDMILFSNFSTGGSTSGKWSLNTWIYPTQVTSMHGLLSHSSGGPVGNACLFQDGKIGFMYYGGLGWLVQYEPTASIEANKPYMLTWSLSGGPNYLMSLYVNGVLKHSFNLISDNGIETVNKIGGTWDGGNPYKGNIFSWYFYNKTLSQSEVTQNYNAQKTKYGL